MSKVKLTGESSGYVEISAGTAAGNNTLELPTSGNKIISNNYVGVVTATTFSGDVTVGTGATISGSTDTIIASTNGSERLRITSSGNIGIGTDNPSKPLQVHSDSSSSVLVTGYTPQIRFNSSADDGTDADRVILGRATGNDQFIPGSVDGDAILRCATSKKVMIGYGTTEIAQFNSSGLKFKTSGMGIDFSAASGSAAGSTSALLDDYEEGTFTPRISVESQGSDAAIDNVSGTYVKVGQLVHCTFNADLNGIPAGRGTGFAWQWGGLPFSSLAEGSDGSEDYIGSVRVANADHTSTYGVAGEFILRLFDNNTGGRIEAMRASNGDVVNASLWMKDNTAITGSITYRTS